ncbi:MAG: hypothetical protein A2175_00110 [Candidatus Nealsonbacteria bacterium RBG_13_42_11]|uniref:GH10 domain-containing protein n=1 Tax=Candidatus Nealsonbacteria bacterium RBG_13_42_11 TaxID=1801663 RepID=A0A1G2DYP8_9BACT|nr:MAG: hypothetical protein A2175_00110 [Candidatus Nealsonbacteria bacterium RBG_13_42_11]
MKKIMLYVLIFVLIVFSFFFIGKPQKKEITWGVNFSQKHAELLGLDWQETYSALIDDLGAKDIKLATYWDLIEPEKGSYNFNDLDWQIDEADKKGAKLLLVIGMKTPRWPECHLPEWAKGLSRAEQQENILNLLKEIVLRYKDRISVEAWQVENESFFPFGDCPWIDKEFLKKEIELVKSLDDQKRPVVITDSGEGSFWIQAAKLGDIVGTTMYRTVWVKQLGIYFSYPYPPNFYWRKAQIIENLFNKKVICVELQAEPWGPKLLYDSPLQEQEKSMNLEQFQKNISFARKTGFDTFYLWGAEWWYWMKEKQNNSSFWEEARKLF